jgi:hypothetical protein
LVSKRMGRIVGSLASNFSTRSAKASMISDRGKVPDDSVDGRLTCSDELAVTLPHAVARFKPEFSASLPTFVLGLLWALLSCRSCSWDLFCYVFRAFSFFCPATACRSQTLPFLSFNFAFHVMI